MFDWVLNSSLALRVQWIEYNQILNKYLKKLNNFH